MTSEKAPLYLALDTSTGLGSVALGSQESVLARSFLLDPRGHAAGLIPAVQRVLAHSGVPPSGVDGVIVGAGPGSFTGVRVAAATAKGLARAMGVPLWAFSSLAAGAASGEARVPGELSVVLPGPVEAEPEDLRRSPHVILFDARRERVYAACYRIGASSIESLLSPAATNLDAVMQHASRQASWEGAVFCGNGALRHRERIERAGFPVSPPPSGIPTAEGLIRLVTLIPDAAPLADPSGWEPEYLKPSSAERSR